MYKNRKRYDKNGYVVVEYPEHPRAFDTGIGFNGVYEHVLMAENDVINRPLEPHEVVHHLDFNKINNSPDNLLVLDGSQHSKLHSWLKQNIILPQGSYKERQNIGCIRCRNCEIPIRNGFTFCRECINKNNELRDKMIAERPIKEPLIRKPKPENKIKETYIQLTKYVHPSKDELEKLVWSKPTTQVAKDFGVSDKAIEKLCKKLDVEKPPRGYWAKIEEGYLITKLDF